MNLIRIGTILKRGKPNIIILAFILYCFPILSAANQPIDDSSNSYRPIGKPLLRHNDFIKRRFEDMVIDDRLRINAIEQSLAFDKYSAKYFENFLTSTPKWKNIGPFDIGGRVRSIAVHPTNTNILYIGAAAGGIWKSINGGSTWEPIFDFENATSFGSLAIDKNNPDVLYAATGEMIIGGGIPYLGNGVYKTTDAGKSWFQVGLTQVAAFSKIYVHPLNSNLIYASGAMRNGGVYKSTNAGNSWIKTYDGNITDLSINPLNQNELYAGVNIEGVVYSSDGGNSWEKRINGLTNLGGRISVQAYEKDFKILYCLAERGDTRGGIFKSTNGGIEWRLIFSGNDSFFNSQGYYNNFIAIHPSNPSIALAGGIDLWITNNGGANWTVVNDRTSPSRMHVDQHHAVFAPSQNNIVYVANDGGIYRSINTGMNWTDMNKGLHITQFYALSIDGMKSNRNFGGTQDNGTVGNPSDKWKMLVGGDGFDSFLHPNDPDILFGEIYYGEVFRYDIKRDNFKFLKSGLPSDDIGAWHSPFIFDERNHTIYLGRNAIYASYNYGEFFYALTPRYNHQFTAIAASNKNSRIIYAGNRVGQIIVTKDAGITWENINSSKLPGKYITSIITSPNDEATLYVSFSGYGNKHIFKSSNYGMDWTAIDLTLPDVPINSIILHPENEEIIFAASDIGVFATFNGGNDWLSYGSDLPRTPVMDLKFHSNRYVLPELTLRAATYGRSVWEIEVPKDILTQATIVSPSGGEFFIGGANTEISWYGFDYPVRVEYSQDFNSSFQLLQDSVYTNRINIQLPDINTFTARIRVVSLSSGQDLLSRTFSITPRYKGAILAQTSLGYNSYGIKFADKSKLWVVDYRNATINLYNKNNLALLRKLQSPVAGFYTDIAQSNDTLFLHKMSDENGSNAELILIDTNGVLIRRIPSPANYPMGLSYSNGQVYLSERDGQKLIYKLDISKDFAIQNLRVNPVLADFGPRCIAINNDLFHQVSTYFNSNTLSKSEVSVFSLTSGNIIESIQLTDRNGIINARGIDIDPEDGNYWITNFTGNLYKIASGENVTSVDDLVEKFNIFPNPASDLVTISTNKIGYDLTSANNTIQIFDILGIEVLSINSKDEVSNRQNGLISIDISQLKRGIYYIRMGNNVEKFLKI